nr:reverse transcriptase domain-containing protein [Tanacetum cinerariifolium]
ASSSRNAEPAITPVPKTLHEHSRPNQAGFQNSITFPEEQTGEVLDAHDIWLIQSMCKFHGLDTENPYDHIRLFLSIVDNIQADGATKDASWLRFFYFTLKGEAKKWLERLSPIHATSWEQLSSHFLNKFFPLSALHLIDHTSFDFVKIKTNPSGTPEEAFRISFTNQLSN